MSDMQDKHAIKEAIQKLKVQNSELIERVNSLEEQLENVTSALDGLTKESKTPAAKPPPLRK